MFLCCIDPVYPYLITAPETSFSSQPIPSGVEWANPRPCTVLMANLSLQQAKPRGVMVNNSRSVNRLICPALPVALQVRTQLILLMVRLLARPMREAVKR